MPRVSAFIFELETKERDFDNFLIKTFNKLKIDTHKELPWEGFLLKTNSTDSIASEKDEFGTLKFTYILEEEVDFQSANGKTVKNRIKENVAVWIDQKSKLMSIFTSKPGIAFKIIRKIIESLKEKSFTITPCKFDIGFLKWLENIEDYGNSILLEIYGTRATKLGAVDGVADTLSLTTTSILNKSQVFKLIKDKGSRVYLKGLFQIDSYQIEASFYTDCKITLSKRKSVNLSMEEAKHSLKNIYLELKKWFNQYKQV